jgi:DNA helicase-2/ATP-dependent DNA helicase PcrA
LFDERDTITERRVADAASSDPDALLRGLDESQRAAVIHESELLAVSAPAGSGKTRTLTRRIAWRCATGRASAPRVLAVTFTRKAAGELRSRLAGPLGCGEVTAGTFHSIALAQLRRRASDRGKPFPGIVDRKAQLLVPVLGLGKGPAATVALRELAAEIEWAKARALTADAYAAAAESAQRPLPRPAAEIADIYARYEKAKRAKQLIDLDDVLWWCADTFEQDADFAAGQRFRFRHLYVDEFQDITPAQLRVLRGWLGTRRDLTAVGDDAQAIYGFAGAQPHALDRFERLFPGAALLRLSTNYRSTQPIVVAADTVLGGATAQQRPTPRAARTDGAWPTVRAYDYERGEARGVATALRAAHNQGVAWRAMAVLYRTNAQSAEFETVLDNAGIPFRVRGSSRFLERPEVRAVLDDLRKIDRSGRRPLRDQIDDIAALTAELNGEQREHVEAVVQLAREFVAMDGGQGTVAGFMAWLNTSTRGEGPVSGDAVELSSFHAAKGLEWDVVFVVGVEQGLVPISYARTTEARSEEQRLLHVALSRAATELHVSWARMRGRPRKPSPWLGDLEECIATQGAPSRRMQERNDPKANVARAKATLAAHANGARADAAVLDALKTWRRNLARAHDIPAFTIFNDATLIEIATLLPKNRTSLLDVRGVGPAKIERYAKEVLEIVGSGGATAS